MSKSEEYYNKHIQTIYPADHVDSYTFINFEEAVVYGQICKLEGKIEATMKHYRDSTDTNARFRLRCLTEIEEYEKELEKIIQG